MHETIPALEDIVNEANNLYTRKAAWRVHSDRAGELASPTVKAYFRQKGVRVTSTAGYEPNSNGRAENAAGIIKEKARVMLAKLGGTWPSTLARCGTTRLLDTIAGGRVSQEADSRICGHCHHEDQ